jgi:cell division protein FtsQ
MAKVKRSPTGVRRSAAARNRSQKAHAARKHTSGLFDRAMAALPFTEEQWHRFFLFVIIAAGLGIAWTIASYAGVPEMAKAELAKSASRSGFEVSRVRVSGVERMNEQQVYERVLAEQDRPMPLVELDAVRARLLDLPWVADARVSRQLPDTLKIDIVERVPHAVLRKPDRRWNLTFKTGQLLALPEGDLGAPALVKFAQLDGMHRLIGGKPIAIDMRVPDRAYLRCADGPCPKQMALNGKSE